MFYFQTENPGIKGWISHEDSKKAQISQYIGNVWITENREWAIRVGATELTYEEAQAIADNIIAEAQASWTPESEEPYPQRIIIPQ
jgi:hypothetical protein